MGEENTIDLSKAEDDTGSALSENEKEAGQILEIPLSEIDDFPEHPFRVNLDEDMQLLVDSIRQQGVLTPIMVRKKDDGRYELISGHRRKKACELAGIDTIRAEVREMSRDDAIIAMVQANYQRSEVLPSEKAHSYKMMFDAMKRQGKRKDITSSPKETKIAQRKPYPNSSETAERRLTDIYA